jgi:FkbM family methyltransferase
LSVKYRVRAVARRFGYDIVRLDADLPAFVSRTLRRLGIRTVLDVGANEGQYGQWLRALCYSGEIVSFEPVSTTFQTLDRHVKDDPCWRAVNVALGAESARTVIHVSENSQSSSLLPMLASHTASAPSSRYVADEVIDVKPLSVFGEMITAPAWMKVDVQGTELEVIAGAGQLLSSIPVIQLELSLRPLYADSPSMPRVIETMAAHGYQLSFLNPGFQDPETGVLLQADGIFIRADQGSDL